MSSQLTKIMIIFCKKMTTQNRELFLDIKLLKTTIVLLFFDNFLSKIAAILGIKLPKTAAVLV